MPNQKSSFKIKIIESEDYIELEKQVNEFCEDIFTVNIKIMKNINNDGYLAIITYLMDKREY